MKVDPRPTVSWPKPPEEHPPRIFTLNRPRVFFLHDGVSLINQMPNLGVLQQFSTSSSDSALLRGSSLHQGCTESINDLTAIWIARISESFATEYQTISRHFLAESCIEILICQRKDSRIVLLIHFTGFGSFLSVKRFRGE